MSMPVLLIQGEADRVNRADENADRLLPLLPDGRIERPEDIGHLPELEAPERVNALLRAFFAAVA